MLFRSLVACLFLVSMLSACGGSSSSSGNSSSGDDNGTPPTNQNVAPVANAGSPQSVILGSVVTLDGSSSSDADGDLLTYSWNLSSIPEGSTVALDQAATPSPTFEPDVEGTYVARLIVNDGQVNSDPATVSISVATANAAPVANAGSSQNVLVGDVVSLDGSNSSDANSDSLTYAWSLQNTPTSSAAALAGATTMTPVFEPDVEGAYVVSLIVNDGQVDSDPATVSISATAANAAPVANAGSPQSVILGSVVTLDGSSSSDADGDLLTYSWNLTSIPEGSAVALDQAATPSPTFEPDVEGTYVASLIVNDGQVDSAPATVSVSAAEPPPAAVDYYLFGGPESSVYLGCLSCGQFDSESVCNESGTYGSEFSSESIWNEFGTYGNEFSSSSPWNQFSRSGPIIIGSDELFYGYFTTNAFQTDRTTIGVLVEVLNYFSTTNDLAATRDYACGD